jgi:hypothetical protein
LTTLKPGEFSPIIALGDGLRILKLIAREPAGLREFSDPRVQQTITFCAPKEQRALRHLVGARDAQSVNSSAAVMNRRQTRNTARTALAETPRSPRSNKDEIQSNSNS